MRKARKSAQLASDRMGYFPWDRAEIRRSSPPESVAADWQALAHNNTCGPLPRYYLDLAFVCAGCGKEDLWTAKQQKWWYEIAKGDINTTAKYCRACRNLRRLRKHSARATHFRGLVAKHGIEGAAKLLQLAPEALSEFADGGSPEHRT